MREKIRALLRENGNLPALPDILMRIQRAVQSPDSSMGDVAKLVELEPVLSGRIMQLAGSAYYSRNSKPVKTLAAAIGMLGLKQVMKLIYSLEMTKLFSDSAVLDSYQFWKHSLAVALFTQHIARRSNSGAHLQEVSYLAGLMHDVGIMVFGYVIPGEYTRFLEEAPEHEKTLEMQEKERFGIDHAEVGAEFIETWWKLDADIVNAVRFHHFPFEGLEKERRCEQIVNVANGICNNQGITNGINCVTEVFKEGAWLELGLSLADAEAIIGEVHSSLAQANELVGFISK